MRRSDDRRPGSRLRLCRRLTAVGVLALVVSGCGSEPGGGNLAPGPTSLPSVTTSGFPTAGTPSPTARATGRPPAPGTGPLQPTTGIVPARGCTILTPGMNGVKVRLVQDRLGFPATSWETMDDATIEAVRRFQRRAGLPVDGVVGPRTWRALGIEADFCLDRYQASPVLPATATAHERREQVITFAMRFLGEQYVWGGAGPRGYGVDCSGLVLQALYSAGLDPQPITVDKHVLPDYRTSRELYEHPRLAHLPLSAVRRGDLVFWRSNETGKVNHVAIYLGDGRVIEAIEPRVHLGRLGDRSSQTMMPEVVRPFGATTLTG